MPSRTNRILEILTERTRVEVSALAEELGVSQVTMRKDLTELERRHLVRREHGYAVLRSTDNVEGRLAYHYEEKRAIARRAAELVRDGDTVMVESGSCCALLVAQLAAERREVTVITNSAFIASSVRDDPTVRVVLIGGIYQKDSQVMVGSPARTASRREPASPTATRCAPRPCATWPSTPSAWWCSRRARSSAAAGPSRLRWARRTSA